jgi:hypothetical protein
MSLMSKNFEIVCPGCEATIIVDGVSGEVLLHKPRERKPGAGSLEAMVSSLESQKSEAAKRFEKQLESQKDRSRILEEKFKEAMQRADRSDTKPFNPMDYD